MITGDQIQITYQDDNSLEKVKEQQNSWLWPVQFFNDKEYEVKAENSYDQNLLNEAVNQLQCLQEGSGTPSQDARVEDNGVAYAIVPEVYGTQLDKEKTTAAIQKAVEERKTEISLEAEDCYIKPGVLQNDEKLKAGNGQAESAYRSSGQCEFWQRTGDNLQRHAEILAEKGRGWFLCL